MYNRTQISKLEVARDMAYKMIRIIIGTKGVPEGLKRNFLVNIANMCITEAHKIPITIFGDAADGQKIQY